MGDKDNISLLSQEEKELVDDIATWDNINEFFGEIDFNALKEISEKISYDINDYVSKPAMSDDWKFSKEAVSLVSSFGYDCLKRSNLHCLSKNILIFSAGSYVELLNVETKEQKFIRSTSYGSIGAIAVHPSKNLFASAEKGINPNIAIYTYPALRLCRLLKNGTERLYNHACFSPNGKLLASVGGDPDYMLTVWDWSNEVILLRSKAFSQDVFRISFSKELNGLLTSAGTGHIRFWKMAKTFTGLKLQGYLGKFQKKEISDAEGYVELPDGKVLAGCEWGNMLLWEGGLIKVELSRKNRKPCHDAAIQQIFFNGGNILTVGLDGYVRVWDFEAIDNADVINDVEIMELEPINELLVGEGVQLKSVVKACKEISDDSGRVHADDEEDSSNTNSLWYAQDASGSIWKLDLSFLEPSISPEKLLSFHSGPVTSICTSHRMDEPLFASIGIDCTVRIHDYVKEELKCMATFGQPGTSLLWLPERVDKSGSSILAGFEDGVLRLLAVQRKDIGIESGNVHKPIDNHNSNVTNSSSIENLQDVEKNPEENDAIETRPSPSSVRLLSTSLANGKMKNEMEIMLAQVLKPHKGRIVAMDVDCYGKTLATASHDGTVFLFELNIENNQPLILVPTGFVSLPSAVTFIKWSPSSHNRNTLLVCCEEGHVVEIEHPSQSRLSKQHTYRLEDLVIRKHIFKSVRSTIEHEEKLAEIASKKKSGAEEENSIETEKIEKEEAEEAWKPHIPLKSSNILCGFHSSVEGRVWIVADEYDSGYLYEIEFIEDKLKEKIPKENLYSPTNVIKLSSPNSLISNNNSNGISVQCLLYDEKNRFVILGLSDGAMRIQPISDQPTAVPSSSFWSYGLHDSSYGRICCIASSPNNNYLFTVGMDGNVFKFKYNLCGDKKEKEMKVEISDNKFKYQLLREPTNEDIRDPKAYSMEDARQKSEYDFKLRESERKKARKRKEIEELREEFSEIKKLNKMFPEELKIFDEEFEMDQSIKRELLRQRENKINNLRKEMAWSTAKHNLEYDKVYKKYIEPISCDLVLLKDFRKKFSVSSFRAGKLSEKFFAIKEKIISGLNNGNMQADAASNSSQIGEPDEKNQDGGVSNLKFGKGFHKIKVNIGGTAGERVARSLKKVMEIKTKRDARSLEWIQLYSEKPNMEEDDPEDIKELDEARALIGDYKLKSGCDYVVPEHLKMTVPKAWMKIITLNEMIYEKKQEFNRKLLSLRNNKTAIVETLKSYSEELKEIISKLGYETADSDEIKEMLIPILMEPCEVFDETCRFISSPIKDNSPPVETENETHRKRADELSSTNELEAMMMKAEKMKLAYRRDEIVTVAKKLKERFDAELLLLRNEKFIRDIEFMNAEMRLITLLQELDILKNFEKTENKLSQILNEKIKEKNIIQLKVAELQQKMEVKKKDLEKCLEKEKELFSDFLDQLSEHKYAEFLTKVYKKKVKRSKKKTLEAANSQPTADDSDQEYPTNHHHRSSESSSDSSDFSSDFDAHSDDIGKPSQDLDTCPAGCDQASYDKTCLLREKRLDVKDAIIEDRAMKDSLAKELENVKEKLIMLEVAVKAANNDLEVFQLEKQKKINELDVVVTLTLKQIEALTSDKGIPSDMSDTVVFETSELERLKKRITELKEEKADIKRQQNEAKKKHRILLKDKRIFSEVIEEARKECDQMIKDKFGKQVNLEAVEMVTVNQQLEETRAQLNSVQEMNLFEIQALENKIKESKARLAGIKKENSKLVDEMNELCRSTLHLEKTFEAQQSMKMRKSSEELLKNDLDDCNRLKKLVRTQNQVINDARREVLMLSLKISQDATAHRHDYN